ncbi:MAG: transcriptional regulator [Pikeienuella sp.]
MKPLRIDIENRQVEKNGRFLNLRPKAFDLLRFLVENRGRLVTGQDILRDVWSDRLASQSTLKVTLQQLRRALDDPAD